MSTLSSIVKRNVVDARKEGYPCFGIWANDGNSNTITNFRVFNSDFQIISPPHGGVTNTTASYTFGMAGDASYGYSADALAYFSTISEIANGTMTNTASNSSIYCKDQFPVGMYADCSAAGYMSGNSIYASSSLATGAGRFLIDQILPEGVRPRRYFCVNGNSFWEAPSLQNIESIKSSVTLNTYRTANTRTQSWGSACYNENTKTLITTHGNGTTSIDVNVFKSTVDLNSVASVVEFFAAATVTSCVITISYDVTNAQDRAVVLGDNGNFVVAYRTANNLTGYHVNISNIASPVVTALNTVVGTTSYGSNTDVKCSTKLQTTWDGKWAIIYQAYYYYGSGVCAYVVSTEDPQRYFTILNTSSSGGGMITPLGRSEFAYLQGQNTDSNGIAATIWDFTTTSRTGTANTVYGSTATGSRNSVIANGGALGATLSTFSLTGGYYSTCYPHFMTVNWWPLNGKTSFEGAYR